MKAACLLGVHEYDQVPSLPACRADLDLMNLLLGSTEEYEAIKVVDGALPAAVVKQEIVAFISSLKGKSIDQVLFYFSGHGDYDGNDFRYLLRDYDSSRTKQTTIENAELDDWLRLLGPQLTVKIVDACHAGVQYVKDPAILRQHLEEGKTSFKSCYFLFSSLQEQSSYQNQDFSFFTRSVAEAVVGFTGEEMRFKDLVDSVSDSFLGNAKQTPYFIIQATNTERFARTTSKMKDALRQALEGRSRKAEEIEEKDTHLSVATDLVTLVKADAGRYCSMEEGLARIEALVGAAEKFELGEELSSLFELDRSVLDSLEDEEIPETQEVGQWLSRNDNSYFARPTTYSQEYTEEIRVPRLQGDSWIDQLQMSNILGLHGYETKTVKRSREVVDGFRLTQEMESCGFHLLALPSFENLSQYECHLLFVLSKTEVRFFYLFSVFASTSWEHLTRQSPVKWATKSSPLKNEAKVISCAQNILDDFKNFISSSVREQFGLELYSSGETQDESEKS